MWWCYLNINQGTRVTAINLRYLRYTRIIWNILFQKMVKIPTARSDAWSAWGGQSSRAEARRATLRGVSSWWPWSRAYPMGGRLSVDIATVLGGTNLFIWNLLDTFQIPTKSNGWFVLSISGCDASWVVTLGIFGACPWACMCPKIVKSYNLLCV